MTTQDSNSIHSTLRERIVEHVFVGDALRALWRRRVFDVEVMRSEFDAFGYDIIMSRGSVVRHIQFKTQGRGKVGISRRLCEKPSGCVVWMVLDPQLKLGPFYWLGGKPGKPMPDISAYARSRHTRGKDEEGKRLLRAAHHDVPRTAFKRLDDIDSVLEELFGALPRELTR